MADSAEEFIIKLNQQVSGPASVAEAALIKLEAQIRSQIQSVKALERAQMDAAGKVAAAQQTAKIAQDKLAYQKHQPFDAGKLRAAYAEATAAAKGLSEAQGGQGKAAEALAKGRGELQLLTGQLPRYQQMTAAAEAQTESFGSRLQAALGSAPGWAGKLAAAIMGVVLAFTAAVVVAGRFVVTAADAARSARLLNDAAGGSATRGAELSAVVRDLANKIPLAKDRIAEMGRQLEIAHLQGRRMQNALTAMGITAAVVGDSAAAKLGQIAEQAQKIRRFVVGRFDLEGTGLAFDDLAATVAESAKTTIAQARIMLQQGRLSVDQGLEAMAAAVQKKFGKTVAAQMIALSTQWAKLKESFAAIFASVDIEPILVGLKMVTSLLDQNTTTGRTLKLMFETLFNPLMKQGSVIFPAIRAFLQGIIIGVLIVEIAFLKVKKAIAQALGGETKSSIDWVKVALYAGVAAVGALAGAMAGMAVAAIALGTALLIVFFPVLATMAALGLAIYLVVRGVKAAANAIGAVDLSSAAHNIVNSFVNGIKAKIGDVVAAMSGLGGAAAGALKAALGIASPSKVALEAAHNVTSTFAGTVEDGTGETQKAFTAMVDPKARAGGKAAPSGSPIYIKIDYSGDSQERRKSFYEELIETLQQHTGHGPVIVGP
jgi:hypothetical protein